MTDPTPRNPDSAIEPLRRHVAEVGGRVWLEQALEQARAEGRQQAAREAQAAVLRLPKWDKRTVPGGFHVHRAAVIAVLDRVAGLDASEHPGEYEIDGMDGGTYRFSGDASDE